VRQQADENGAVSQVCGRFGPRTTAIAARQNCDNRSIASHGNRLGCHVLVAVASDDIEQLAFVHVRVHVGCHAIAAVVVAVPTAATSSLTRMRRWGWAHPTLRRQCPGQPRPASSSSFTLRYCENAAGQPIHLIALPGLASATPETPSGPSNLVAYVGHAPYDGRQHPSRRSHAEPVR
jgi:hypothetical protein